MVASEAEDTLKRLHLVRWARVTLVLPWVLVVASEARSAEDVAVASAAVDSEIAVTEVVVDSVAASEGEEEEVDLVAAVVEVEVEEEVIAVDTATEEELDISLMVSVPPKELPQDREAPEVLRMEVGTATVGPEDGLTNAVLAEATASQYNPEDPEAIRTATVTEVATRGSDHTMETVTRIQGAKGGIKSKSAKGDCHLRVIPASAPFHFSLYSHTKGKAMQQLSKVSFTSLVEVSYLLIVVILLILICQGHRIGQLEYLMQTITSVDVIFPANATTSQSGTHVHACIETPLGSHGAGS